MVFIRLGGTLVGWLGTPSLSVALARLGLRRINAMSAGDLPGGAFGVTRRAA